MSRIDIAIRQAELQKEREMSTRLGEKMSQSTKEVAGDGLRNTVLSVVANEHYDRAITDLEDYIDNKSDFPQYRERAGRFLLHSKELILAIRAKRSFQGADKLSIGKQQDLYDRAMEHFEALKLTLRKMEALYIEVKQEDVRSTVWVLQAAVYSIFAITALGIFIELTNGVLPAAGVLLDSAFGSLINTVFDRLGF